MVARGWRCSSQCCQSGGHLALMRALACWLLPLICAHPVISLQACKCLISCMQSIRAYLGLLSFPYRCSAVLSRPGLGLIAQGSRLTSIRMQRNASTAHDFMEGCAMQGRWELYLCQVCHELRHALCKLPVYSCIC